jgi:DNA-binding transcriptional LysR family regulator
MFDWNDLRYFLAVARTGSTISAAKELGVNQSTVQRRLSAFENSIGCKLVERHATGYRLSELGKELLTCAEGVEQAVMTVERRLVSNGGQLTGAIRVTCPEGMVSSFVAPLVKEFHAQYPGLRVDLIVTERLLDLSKGEADVALRGGEPQDDRLIARKIADTEWAIYASRSYVDRHGRPAQPEDINNHAMIDSGIAPGHKWWRSVAPRARIAAHSETLIGLLLAVKSGAGLAILPMPLGDVQDDLVRVIDPAPKLLSPINLLVHPDLRNVPRVRTFLDFVVGGMETYRRMLLGEIQLRM